MTFRISGLIIVKSKTFPSFQLRQLLTVSLALLLVFICLWEAGWGHCLGSHNHFSFTRWRDVREFLTGYFWSIAMTCRCNAFSLVRRLKVCFFCGRLWEWFFPSNYKNYLHCSWTAFHLLSIFLGLWFPIFKPLDIFKEKIPLIFCFVSDILYPS